MGTIKNNGKNKKMNRDQTILDKDVLVSISKKADDLDGWAAAMKNMIAQSESLIIFNSNVINELEAILSFQKQKLYEAAKKYKLSMEQMKSLSQIEAEIISLEKELADQKKDCSISTNKINSEIDNVSDSVRKQIAKAFNIVFSW